MQTRRFPASLLPALLCASLFGCGDDGDDSATGPALEATLADAVPLALDAVILQGSDTFLALLSSADGDSLSLPVNRCQADVIAAALGGVVFPRPMTHDLFATIADSLELSVTHVLLDIAGDASAEGHLLLVGPRTRQSLPTSVGDALAIAQQTSVPLLGTRALLDHHAGSTGVRLEAELSDVPSLPSSAASISAKAVQLVQSPDGFVDMRVLGLVQLFADVAVVLADPDDSVAFPIFISLCQAAVIYNGLHGEEHPVTQSHDLLYRLLELGGARMTRAAVVDLVDGTFIGEIDLSAPSRSLAIDARPSDAVALATLTGAPIQVLQSLLSLVGEDPAPYLDLFAEEEAGG